MGLETSLDRLIMDEPTTTTAFSTGWEVMNIAGPGGLLIAWTFVAIISICVMKGLSEMAVLWPVSNAMVKAFVDRDLAIVIRLAYWFVDSYIPLFGSLW